MGTDAVKKSAAYKDRKPAVAAQTVRKMHDDGKSLLRSLRPRCVEDECAPHIEEVRGAQTRPSMDFDFFAALPDMDLTFFIALPDNGGHG